MILKLSKEDLKTGSHYVTIDSLSRLLFYSVDEQFLAVTRVTTLKRIVIYAEATSLTGEITRVRCPSIIGLSNEFISIESDDPSKNGTQISMENLDDWQVRVNV